MTILDQLNELPTLAELSLAISAEHDAVCEERKLSLANALHAWIQSAALPNSTDPRTITFNTVCECENEIASTLQYKGYTVVCENGAITITL